MNRYAPLRRTRIKRKAPRRVTRPGPGSDPAYLDAVRKLPCRVFRSWATYAPMVCEGEMHAHHAGPKKNDSTAVPLCWKHHGQWHDANGVFKDWRKEERRAWAEASIEDTRKTISTRRQHRNRG